MCEIIRNLFSAGRKSASLVLITSTIFAAGCSAGNLNNTLTGANATSSLTQVKIGDAPADSVLSFEVTVGPITLTPDTGVPVIILSTPQRIELSHLSATSVPAALLNIPQGSYTSATITFANPEVTFLNSAGAVQKIEPALSQTVTINLSPSLAITGSSSIVNIDVNLGNAVSFDSQGNLTGVNFSTSSFSVSLGTVVADSHQSDEHGELEDMTGTIAAVNGTSFTLTANQTGAQLVFATDSNTEFKDGASLKMNTVVTVEGTTRADGTLYARKVEGVENEGGTEAEGLITATTGTPTTTLTIVADNGTGTGMGDSTIGNTMLADISNAQFEVKQGDLDTSSIGNLPSSPNFPFDATTIHSGQRVELDSKDSFKGTSFTANRIRLQQQALVGTVSGLSGPTSSGPATFTLTVASDSAFATLSGKTQVTVFWQPGTDLQNLTAVSNGSVIRVRGLVFYTGSAFNMIARRITK